MQKKKAAFLAASSLSKKSFLHIFGCCCTPVLLRKPLENCLRAVRRGPHFVQSTKPQFSEVVAFRESRRYTVTKIGVQPVKKRGFPLAGNAGQAVRPASGFSGVRILSGRLSLSKKSFMIIFLVLRTLRYQWRNRVQLRKYGNGAPGKGLCPFHSRDFLKKIE